MKVSWNIHCRERFYLYCWILKFTLDEKSKKNQFELNLEAILQDLSFKMIMLKFKDYRKIILMKEVCLTLI